MSDSSVSSCKTPSPPEYPCSSEDTSANLPIPPLFRSMNQLNVYEPQEVIGSAQDVNASTPVYKGTFFPFGLPLRQLAGVPVVMRHASPGLIKSFVRKINANRLVTDSSIVAVKDEIFVEEHLWVVFPFCGLSVRELYPQGVQSEHVLVLVKSLYCVVSGLVSIHLANMIHGEINLGHIHMNSRSEFHMGFEATVYDPAQEAYTEFNRASKICDWASAPEVYHRMNNKAYHTMASDIWQVGITALELALGDLQVRNRRELDDLIKAAITRYTNGIFGNQNFKSFLQVCLQYDSIMRPSSWTLRNHELFRAFYSY